MTRAIVTLTLMWAAGFAGGFVAKAFLGTSPTKATFMNGCMNGAAVVLNATGIEATAQGVEFIKAQCEEQGKQQRVWQ